MKVVFAVVSALVLLSAQVAAAQQRTGDGKEVSREVEAVVERSGLDAALDSIATTAGPELQEALEQLTTALGVVAGRVATDPALRVAAVRTAEGLVSVAQVVLEEQADELQDTLRVLAERLAALSPPPAAPDEVR